LKKKLFYLSVFNHIGSLSNFANNFEIKEKIEVKISFEKMEIQHFFKTKQPFLPFKLNKMMKKIVFALFLFFAIGLVLPACSRKSGCPATENLAAKQTKKGGYKKSGKTKSGLYPSKMRKKVGVRG
jgi:hypothetical protein